MAESGITELLEADRDGDTAARARVFELLYGDLRRLAHRHVRTPGQTLNVTSVVHEAYLKLVDQTRGAWSDRGHFLAVASRAMRQVVIDYARSKKAAKRGGGQRAVTLDEQTVGVDEQASALLERAALQNQQEPPELTQAALDRLQRHDWPGNVRELENALTQAMVFARDGQITAEHVRLKSESKPAAETAGNGPVADEGPLLSLDQVEAAHIQRVLDHTGGHKGNSCEILGISRPALDRKIGKYGLTLPGRD